MSKSIPYPVIDMYKTGENMLRKRIVDKNLTSCPQQKNRHSCECLFF